MKLDIKIANVTEAQALAIEEFLAVWLYMRDTKMSMWTSFFADSNADFAPDIMIKKDDTIWNTPKRFMQDIGLRVGKVKFPDGEGKEPEHEIYLLDYLKIQNVLEGKSPILKDSSE